MSDLTAVAYLKDPKGRRQYMFGLFSPSRNFHLQAKDEKDAKSWVELIRHEARIDEKEQEMIVGSPVARETPYQSLDLPSRSLKAPENGDHERFGSSSPEPGDFPFQSSTTRDGIRIPGVQKQSTHDLEYSGNDLGSYSDFSDTAPPQPHGQRSFLSPSQVKMHITPDVNTMAVATNSPLAIRPETARNASQISGFHIDQDEERVIWHGYLLCLKSKGGVRQWKKLWVVLRPKNLAFYKNEEVRHLLLALEVSNRLAGIRRPLTHPSLQHHQRRRNRSSVQKQVSLHADHCRRQELSILRAKRRGFGSVARGIEEPACAEKRGKIKKSRSVSGMLLS